MTHPPAEEWREVAGYEGLYEVSSFGRIRSLERTKVTRNRWGQVIEARVPQKVRRLNIKPGGYRNINLSKDGVVTTFPVQRVVCEAFHGPPAVGMEAAHWDGDPANNREDNLRWATPVENQSDRVRHGRDPGGSRNGRAKITPEIVSAIRRRLASETGKALAAEYGISQSQVVHIKKGRCWAAEPLLPIAKPRH